MPRPSPPQALPHPQPAPPRALPRASPAPVRPPRPALPCPAAGLPCGCPPPSGLGICIITHLGTALSPLPAGVELEADRTAEPGPPAAGGRALQAAGTGAGGNAHTDTVRAGALQRPGLHTPAWSCCCHILPHGTTRRAAPAAAALCAALYMHAHPACTSNTGRCLHMDAAKCRQSYPRRMQQPGSLHRHAFPPAPPPPRTSLPPPPPAPQELAASVQQGAGPQRLPPAPVVQAPAVPVEVLLVICGRLAARRRPRHRGNGR